QSPDSAETRGRLKAAVLEALGTLVVTDVPQPAVGPGGVLVRVRACGICASDLRIIRHGHAKVTPPASLGHEIVGEVAALGTDVAGWAIGERVTLTPRIFCGTCWYCQRGRVTHCPQGRSLGYVLPGGFAEALLVPPEGVRAGILQRVPITVAD